MRRGYLAGKHAASAPRKLAELVVVDKRIKALTNELKAMMVASARR